MSYVKAMDIWFITCIGFVFAAFLEFAVVNAVYRYTRKRRLRQLEVRLTAVYVLNIMFEFWVAMDERDEVDEFNHKNYYFVSFV